MPRGPKRQTLSERVENWFNTKTEDDGYCWTWTGTRTSDGVYGWVGWQGKMTRPHRLVYILFNGEPADGEVITHTCGNHLCINPGHLTSATPGQINKRRAENVTECKNGHPFTPSNTHITTRGNRRCRACDREKKADMRARQKEGATR